MLDLNSYELINYCSPFILFDFIRSVRGKTTATTESTTATEATAIVVALRTASATIPDKLPQIEKWRHRTSSNHTTESVK